MGWRNLLKNTLRPLSEVVISAMESDCPGGSEGGKEVKSTREIPGLGLVITLASDPE